METWPAALRYRGIKRTSQDVNLGGTAEAMPFVPYMGTEGFFVFPYPLATPILQYLSKKEF